MSRDGRGSGAAGVEVEVDLWAMAAELERRFAGYKQRLAERSGAAPDVVVVDDAALSVGEEENGDGGGADVRGRMYEAYTRRRDKRLREGWRARMERKEAEVKALWAQLERATAGGRRGTTTDDGTAGQRAGHDGENRRNSDVVAPASSISGKKPARTRSFSSFTAKSSRPDAGTRRALSQELKPSTPSEPPAATADGGAGSKDGHRGARPSGGGATTAPKREVFSGHRSSAKEHGGSVKGGPKPPRSLQPRRSSSGGLDDLKEPAVMPTTCAAVAAPGQSCLIEQVAVHDETQNASSSTAPYTGAANARAASPYSDSGEVVDGVTDGRGAETNNVEEHDGEEVAVSPWKLMNGQITCDSDTEPSYVYIKKDVEEDDAMTTFTRRSDQALAGSDAKPELEVEKKSSEDAEETTAPSVAVAVAAESVTTIADEAPARESSDNLSFSGRSGAGSPPSSPPASSCIWRAPSIERLLEEDAALLRKKREEESAENRALTTLSTPPPARVSGGPWSPREAVRGFKFKKFLSFGKKNRGREVTVIDCTSPSVPSLADDDSGSGGWQSTDTIKPRMASSDAASDDMDHGYAISARACSLQSLVAASAAKSELNEIEPQDKSAKAHRSFFSLQSFNCGRS